jgi:hypothetical protein
MEQTEQQAEKEELASMTASAEADGETDAEQQAEPDGIESFRDAAEKELAVYGERIAEALRQKAVAGDLNCAKFLTSTARKKKDPNGERVCGKSVAQRLVEGPRWEGPPEEDDEDLDGWTGDPDA